MIRKRIPHQDDRTIFDLASTLLLPYARATTPDVRLTLPILRNRLKKTSTYVLATAGGRPTAFITLRQNRDQLLVDMLAVHSREQGRGIGSQLMQLAERYAGERGCRTIRLWVDEANTRAQHFYMRHGYEPVHFDNAYRCYMMQKYV